MNASMTDILLGIVALFLLVVGASEYRSYVAKRDACEAIAAFANRKVSKDSICYAYVSAELRHD